MGQKTSGIRSILSLPSAYDLVQRSLGAEQARKVIARTYLNARPGELLLDVGCGTGAFLPHLDPRVRYVGFDLSARYIAAARTRFPGRGRFEQRGVDDAPSLSIAPPDVALAFGLLHHLGDTEVAGLLQSLARILAPGGRLVTVDPTFERDQHPIARMLAQLDRGREVRTPMAYEALARSAFEEVKCTVRRDLLRIPYSHCILEMKTAAGHLGEGSKPV